MKKPPPEPRIGSDGVPSRPQQVLSAILDYLDGDSFMKETEVAVRATWIAGNIVCVVYEQSRWPGIYGLAADTDTGITEYYTADPRQLGIEMAMFGIYEPNGMAPPEMVARQEIFWSGGTADKADLPRFLSAVTTSFDT